MRRWRHLPRSRRGISRRAFRFPRTDRNLAFLAAPRRAVVRAEGTLVVAEATVRKGSSSAAETAQTRAQFRDWGSGLHREELETRYQRALCLACALRLRVRMRRRSIP